MSDTEIKPVGRPSKFNPDTCKKIINLIAQCVPYSIAAPANGVGERTLYEWIDEGLDDTEKGIDSDKAQFAQSIKKVEAERIMSHLDKINAGIEKWQGQAWILERRWWREFSQRVEAVELAKDMEKIKSRFKKHQEIAKQAEFISDK